MLRTLWFVSEQLGAPWWGKEREGNFLLLQRKAWSPIPPSEVVAGLGSQGIQNGKNVWGCCSHGLVAPLAGVGFTVADILGSFVSVSFLPSV